MEDKTKQSSEIKISADDRKKTALELTKEIKTVIQDDALGQKIDLILNKISQTCECLATDIELATYDISPSNYVLRDLLSQIASAIRKIPEEPNRAMLDTCLVRVDIKRMPRLFEVFRSEGFEKGYQQALKKQIQLPFNDINIDLE